MNVKNVKAHLALLAAASMWGLMSPVGKAAMDAGITGLSLANMRMIGAACLFWIASFFTKQADQRLKLFSFSSFYFKTV